MQIVSRRIARRGNSHVSTAATVFGDSETVHEFSVNHLFARPKILAV